MGGEKRDGCLRDGGNDGADPRWIQRAKVDAIEEHLALLPRQHARQTMLADSTSNLPGRAQTGLGVGSCCPHTVGS